MKKMLFISNITNRITNFSIPSLEAAQRLGYEFHLAANLSGFEDDPCKYGITTHHIDLTRNPFNLQNIKAYRQMLALIEKERFDAIHCNTPIGGVLGRICGQKAGVRKVIYTAHGFHFYEGAPLLNRTIFKWAEMWLARYTDALITINSEDYHAAQKFKLRNDGKVYYVPGVGIDTTTIQNTAGKRIELLSEINAKKDAILLISVGELNSNKNNIIVIEALAKLENPDIHYLLCGVGNEENKLRKKVVEYGLQNNVHFLGYRSDVPQLLKSADVFLLPSYREGLSRSLMEAMSAGLPCVVSKIRGNVDLIEHGKGGFLHDPDDSGGIAEVLNIIVTNQILRDKMGTFNLEKVREFDVKNVEFQIRLIYKEMLVAK